MQRMERVVHDNTGVCECRVVRACGFNILTYNLSLPFFTTATANSNDNVTIVIIIITPFRIVVANSGSAFPGLCLFGP